MSNFKIKALQTIDITNTMSEDEYTLVAEQLDISYGDASYTLVNSDDVRECVMELIESGELEEKHGDFAEFLYRHRNVSVDPSNVLFVRFPG